MTTTSIRSFSLANVALSAWLCAALGFQSDDVVKSFGLEPSLSTRVFLRRVSMFFMGNAALSLYSLDAPHSEGRQAILLGQAVQYLGLASASIAEYLRGVAKAPILQAGALEVVFGVWAMSLFMEGRASEPMRPNSFKS